MSPRRRDADPGPTASARLADDLRRRILNGDLAPGEPLREEALAGSSGLSRHTVRAALALLTAERLVVQVPYKGIRVRTFSTDDLVALQQLRCALEIEAVHLIRSTHGTSWPASITTPIEHALDDLQRAVDETPRDWPSLARSHAAVHRAIVRASGSPRIAETYALLDTEMLLMLVNMRPSYSARDLIAEHRAYLAELIAGEADAVRRHIDGGTLNAVPHDLG